MFHPQNDCRANSSAASRLIRPDLCAQVAPLDRYGLAGFSTAVVDGLMAIAGRSRNAFRALGRREAA